VGKNFVGGALLYELSILAVPLCTQILSNTQGIRLTEQRRKDAAPMSQPFVPSEVQKASLLRLFVSLRIALDTVPAYFACNICGFPGEMALSGKPRLHLVHLKLAAGLNVSFFPPKSLVY
jgi:hypothetical protein